MATIIVGHKGLDLDCVVSMLALETAIRKIVGFKSEIRFAFVPQGETYRSIKINPKHQYEQVGRDRIYHVDCGLGFFDHHRPGCTAPSSAILVNRAFRLSERFPEWKRLIKWATEADQDRLKCGCALHAIIRGEHRRLGPGHDLEILRFARRAIVALLENEKVKVAAEPVPIETVPEFQLPEPEGIPALQVMKVPDFGKVGLIVGPEEIGGSFRNRLETEAGCRLVISFGTDQGKVGIMSCFPSNGEPVDLRELGIVQAIRAEEAKARGIKLTAEELSSPGDVRGMKWFAHEVEGDRVVNLFNGSAKVDLTEEERTRLPPERIIQIVKDQITALVQN